MSDRATKVKIGEDLFDTTDTIATEQKQDTIIAELEKIRGFDIPEYDNIALSYTGTNLTGVAYKTGVTTVATLTLTYGGAGGELTKVVRS
jgi:hypothetical protein